MEIPQELPVYYGEQTDYEKYQAIVLQLTKNRNHLTLLNPQFLSTKNHTTKRNRIRPITKYPLRPAPTYYPMFSIIN